jgi:hypothetical protein
MLNLGCLFDIPTGRYYLGKHGESILNGGLSHLTGMVGRGNTFKSTIMDYMILITLVRHVVSKGLIFDTELSKTVARYLQLGSNLGLTQELLDDVDRFILTDMVAYSGNVFYDQLKTYLQERGKDLKNNRGLTPILDKDGKNIPGYFPFIAAVDSFSQFRTDSMNKISDVEIGEAGRNVEALRDAMAKNQMIMELPTTTARHGCYMLLSAHVGDEHQLDPYAPPQKKLAFLKNKVKLKNVPEKFTFLTNNCWYALSSEVLVNQTTKGPEFPRDPDDNMKGDPDLMVVTLTNLRAKSGPTGLPIPVVISQSEGVLPGLTEFYYIKGMSRYGLGGNDRNYFVELAPDVPLQRTTVRSKILENPHLKRALEITSEMCQIKHLWHDFPKDLLCEPAELYADLVKKGYDWSILLNTRGYWIFEEEKETLPFLSTKDLLNMRVGKYHPYWYDAVVKKLKGAASKDQTTAKQQSKLPEQEVETAK